MNVTIFSDYKENRWTSMDVYTDNLLLYIKRLSVENFRIKTYAAFESCSRKVAKQHKVLRYGFRYGINPLFAPFHQGDINHIVDQSNAHLLRVLNPKKTVITCHDLIVPFHQTQPQITIKKRIKRIVQEWRMRSLAMAKHIIAVSNATKKDLMNTLFIPADNITVIPEGVEECFQPASSSSVLRFKKKYSLPDTFLLHVGSCEDYKNMTYLLKLFSSVQKQYSSLYLVKTGALWKTEQKKLIQKLNIRMKIITLPYIPRSELPALYSSAVCLLHPSLIEGFAFTVLEAMACGCPVVVSDIPVLHELVQAAGIYVPLNNFSAARHLLQSSLSEPKKTQDRTKKGILRAKHFTWEKTAKRTYDVYVKIRENL